MPECVSKPGLSEKEVRGRSGIASWWCHTSLREMESGPEVMAIRCSKCKREYDVTLFEFGREILCECGAKLGLGHHEVLDQLEQVCREHDLELEEEKLAEIKKAHDWIVLLIMNTDYKKVDIEIEKEKFKDLIRGLFPDKIHLYDLIYEPRFKRLWEQFR